MDETPQRRGVWRNWRVSKITSVKLKDRPYPHGKKTSKGDNRPSWMEKKFLTDFRYY